MNITLVLNITLVFKIQHHSILGSINYKEPSKPAPEFEEFKAYMGNVDVRLNRSEALLEKIAEELGLFKDK